jgi:hypothetical protein
MTLPTFNLGDRVRDKAKPDDTGTISWLGPRYDPANPLQVVYVDRFGDDSKLAYLASELEHVPGEETRP